MVEGEAGRLVAAAEGGAEVGVEALASRPRLVRRLAARRAYELAGGRGELTRRAIDAVEGLLGGGSGREVALAGGVVARRRYDELRFEKRDGAAPRVRVVLDVPGRVEVPEVGLWIEAEVVDTGQRRPAYNADRLWEEVVDLERVGERLVVRTREPGDRFMPFGLGGSKKLKDFLIDERVPRDERERTLVVVGRSGIAWVVGRRLDERAKVRAGTRRYLCLRAGKL
jgi:tRNA(Ile)-lysidine synthase